MNLFVHLSYTLIIAKILNLDKFNFFLAIIFGVLIDLDHIYYYVKNLYKEKKIIQRGYKHRTFLQEPVFYPVVITISIIYKTLSPVIFFSLHLVFDYILDIKRKPFWPFNNLSLKKGIKSYGKLYWLITLTSIILFIVFFLFNNNYKYLIEIFS